MNKAVFSRVLLLTVFLAPTAAGNHTKPPTQAEKAREHQLRQAASRGDNLTVLRLLRQRVNINASEPMGHTTALYQAIEAGKPKTVALLLARGADANIAPDINGNRVSPLIEAVQQRQPQIVLLLIKHGVNIHFVGAEGETALYQAVENGDVPLARLLIAKGGNVNQKDEYGVPPLARALDNLPMVRLLLIHGANPNATVNADTDRTVYTEAVWYSPRAVVQELGRYGGF